MKNDVFDVVDYILIAGDRQPNGADPTTHLKLQKLLYYFQGVHLADRKQPLFSNDIEAWEKGPVVREVFHAFKAYGKSPLPVPRTYNKYRFTDNQLKIMERIYQVFGIYTAGALVGFTHKEDPWKSAFAIRNGAVIDRDSMISHFAPRLPRILGRAAQS